MKGESLLRIEQRGVRHLGAMVSIWAAVVICWNRRVHRNFLSQALRTAMPIPPDVAISQGGGEGKAAYFSIPGENSLANYMLTRWLSEPPTVSFPLFRVCRMFHMIRCSVSYLVGCERWRGERCGSGHIPARFVFGKAYSGDLKSGALHRSTGMASQCKMFLWTGRGK